MFYTNLARFSALLAILTTASAAATSQQEDAVMNPGAAKPDSEVRSPDAKRQIDSRWRAISSDIWSLLNSPILDKQEGGPLKAAERSHAAYSEQVAVFGPTDVCVKSLACINGVVAFRGSAGNSERELEKAISSLRAAAMRKSEEGRHFLALQSIRESIKRSTERRGGLELQQLTSLMYGAVIAFEAGHRIEARRYANESIYRIESLLGKDHPWATAMRIHESMITGTGDNTRSFSDDELEFARNAASSQLNDPYEFLIGPSIVAALMQSSDRALAASFLKKWESRVAANGESPWQLFRVLHLTGTLNIQAEEWSLASKNLNGAQSALYSIEERRLNLLVANAEVTCLLLRSNVANELGDDFNAAKYRMAGIDRATGAIIAVLSMPPENDDEKFHDVSLASFMAKQYLGATSPLSLQCECALVLIHASHGRTELARKQAAELTGIVRGEHGINSPCYGHVLRCAGMVEEKCGNIDGALSNLEAACEVFKQASGGDSVEFLCSKVDCLIAASNHHSEARVSEYLKEIPHICDVVERAEIEVALFGRVVCSAACIAKGNNVDATRQIDVIEGRMQKLDKRQVMEIVDRMTSRVLRSLHSFSPDMRVAMLTAVVSLNERIGGRESGNLERPLRALANALRHVSRSEEADALDGRADKLHYQSAGDK